MNVSQAPDWFYQSAFVREGDRQCVILYYTTREASDELVSVTLRERGGACETIKARDFFKRFRGLDEDDVRPMAPPPVAREVERLVLI